MTTYHAAVWLDHHRARLFQFDLSRIDAAALSRPGATGDCTGLVTTLDGILIEDACASIARLRRVLVTGPKDAIVDFERYVAAYWPQIADCIVGYQVVDEPSARQLLALVWWYFTEPMPARRSGRRRAAVPPAVAA